MEKHYKQVKDKWVGFGGGLKIALQTMSRGNRGRSGKGRPRRAGPLTIVEIGGAGLLADLCVPARAMPRDRRWYDRIGHAPKAGIIPVKVMSEIGQRVAQALKAEIGKGFAATPLPLRVQRADDWTATDGVLDLEVVAILLIARVTRQAIRPLVVLAAYMSRTIAADLGVRYSGSVRQPQDPELRQLLSNRPAALNPAAAGEWPQTLCRSRL